MLVWGYDIVGCKRKVTESNKNYRKVTNRTKSRQKVPETTGNAQCPLTL